MNALAVYHRLPGPLRSWAAGLRGAQLARRRYGPETDRLVEEALRRERWSPAQWSEWRDERLAHVLERAVRRVPYYRRLWRDRIGRRRIRAWPLLEKQTLLEQGEEFVADDLDRRRLWIERTSGTTGTPLKLWRSLRTTRARYALYEARHRRWYGFSRHDRWAMAGGQLVTPRDVRRPPYWVWNRGMRQLYISSHHLAREQAEASVEAIRRYGCRYLLGYPSSLAALARAAVVQAAGGRRRLELGAVIANAEPILAWQRRLIQEAFGSPLRETYGMVELVAAAGECERGVLHVFPEFGHLEVLGDDGRLRDAGEGELVATSLLDEDMPLVRYRTGDRVRLDPDCRTCACGRTLPVMTAVEGRADDVLYAADGRPVGRLDAVFKEDLPILEAQIVQPAVGEVRVRVAAAPGWGRRAEVTLVRALQARLGPLRVVVEVVPEIPRGANGKFRAVISEIPAGERPEGRRRAAC